MAREAIRGFVPATAEDFEGKKDFGEWSGKE